MTDIVSMTTAAQSATAAQASDDGHLFALSDAAAVLVAETGTTPCFAYRLDVARQRFVDLRMTLPEQVHLAYAVKSNPGPPLLAELAGLGAWFDCASAGEVAAVQTARASAPAPTSQQPATRGRMVFAGPAKSEADLRAALAAGARIQVDGIEDVERLAQWHTGPDPLPVNVRVHPLTGISETASIIGGSGPSAFGVDEEELAQFVAGCQAYPQVRLSGLQVFSASNELDAATLLANHRTAMGIGQRLQAMLRHDLDLIDLGGGLGIPYAVGSPDLDIVALGAGLGDLLEENAWFTGHVVLEPGRWLSGPTGVYLTRVVRVKQSRGTTFAVLEGGINHLLRPLMTGQSFPVRAVTPRQEPATTDWTDASGPAEDDRERTAYTLAGPLCTSLDRVGTAELEPLEPGDLVIFGQAGAYGFTQAMTNFLSHPAPEQVWLGGSITP
ncbi:hypothetical protein [Ornithinimicrobium cryptoxanthini]|uniref:Orn/DAP/Arg decarboxylase 2 N-terminal domain-containing protein n=1 Tax=Ornithinimicrobium cryptoxanthini TaxID=2934161 RepID=A0ABY4YLX3_9MICO|nr:hypothetical protein [Ornithinimicrobium cryptoxanthini]USQ77358.1 hypothetical protein NF557_05445 [Ornithinimicrobium cryptoxanthini]